MLIIIQSIQVAVSIILIGVTALHVLRIKHSDLDWTFRVTAYVTLILAQAILTGSTYSLYQTISAL